MTMTTDPYNELVRELFADTRHSGEIDGGTRAYFDDQGVRIHLSAEIAGDTLRSLRFRAFGCPHVIAALEWVCRKFEGQPISVLEDFETGQIMKNLAVPTEKTGRILVIEDTVHSLKAAIHTQTG